VRGDELRSIDWKVFGKSDRLYIRQSEVDTNARCTLIVDCSGSMAYAGERNRGLSKFEYAQQLTAALGYLMLNQQDAVGAIAFDNRVRQSVPCRSRPSHLAAVLSAIDMRPQRERTDIGGVFQEISPRLGRRRLVVVISDFLTDIDAIGRALARLRAARHEVLCFQVLDPDEAEFPFSGAVQFRDLEGSGESRAVDAAVLRQLYLDRFEHHQASLRKVCRQHHVDWSCLRTDQALADALHQFIAARK